MSKKKSKSKKSSGNQGVMLDDQLIQEEVNVKSAPSPGKSVSLKEYSKT
jgi:hypothetical protein